MTCKDECIIAIDFGLKRTGLAISPKGVLIALPASTILSGKNDMETIEVIVKEVKATIDRFILGLPKFLDGKESKMTTRVREFGDILSKSTQKPVHYVDETLTSESSEELLKQRGFTRKKRASYKDSLSAQLILKDFLENPSLF